VGHTSLQHVTSDKIPEKAKALFDKLLTGESIEKTYKKCNEVYNKLSINWDGTVSACCFDFDNYMVIGDLTKTSIQDIWLTSEKLKYFRSVLNAQGHKDLPLCRNCFDPMNLKMSFKES
jgi:radical SAM protein with 4Fe4S-binding SPASM domain